MSTWKSKIVEVTIDDYDDYVKCDSRWEYQTTSDIFSYYEICNKPNMSMINRKIGDEVTKLHLSPESAKNLYHALANWMKVYNSEKEMMLAITDNIYESKE